MRRGSRFLLSVVVCAVAMCRPSASAETRSEGQSALEADWLFQADNKPTLGRAREEIGWARELAARISVRGYDGYPSPRSLARRRGAPDLAKELEELKEIEAGLDGQKETREAACDKYLAVRRIKRRIAFANPAVDFDKVLLIDNPKPAGREPDHEARHRNGFMARNGGRLLVLEGLDPGSPVRDLVGSGQPGSFWRPDASFDAKKVVFGMKPHDELAFHLYEVNVDGTGLKQLTRGDYDDLDPIYLPDGHIMFITSRCNTYVRCMPYTYSFVLARCDADGRNIYIVSCNSEPDYLPSLLNDGRVIYSRWEYTDKALWRVQSLWTTNPDGTNVAAFWGNQSVWPDHVTEARAIPGSRRVMFTGLGHHRWFEGSIGIIDPAPGLNFPWGLTKVTADVAWPEVGNGPVDPKETDRYHRAGRFSAYKSPYPLGEEDFLVSARAGRGNFKLYLMDVYGNRELIFQGRHNAWHAMPLKSRTRPPIIPDRVAWPGTGVDHKPPKPGVLFTSNVFDGAPEIPKDRVKYLRVIEMDAKTYSTWHKTVQHDGPAVGIFQAEAVKRVLGTVPIEADGSVQFELPPGRAVYFQLVDEDFRCIQNMRSFSGVMPGERRGCLGCHEQRNTTFGSRADGNVQAEGQAPPKVRPALTGVAIAMRKPPARLTPPPWGSESIGFERFVQPVLEKHCGKCHMGEGKARKKLDLTLRPSRVRFRANPNHRPGEASPFKEPYITLVGGPLGWGRSRAKNKDGVPLSIAGCFIVEAYDQRDPNSLKTLAPMTIYSHKSRLVENAMSGKHNKVKVDAASLRRLIAWVDTNGPYLGEEEIRKMYDPQFGGVDKLQVRPRCATAPEINRFDIRQDGDSCAVTTPARIAPAELTKQMGGMGGDRQRPAPAKSLTIDRIVKAFYGAGRKGRDVTQVLQRILGRKGARLGGYNSHFGDPVPGIGKQLTITYELGGKQKTVSFAEGTPLTIKMSKGK